MEWLSYGRLRDGYNRRWSAGAQHGVERMVLFETPSLDTTWQDQWAEGITSSKSSSVTCALSCTQPGGGAGIDSIRIFPGCGAALPLGGRWLWALAAKDADAQVVSVASGEWGRRTVAEVAACLRAVKPKLLGAAALYQWTKVAGEVLYQAQILKRHCPSPSRRQRLFVEDF